jgi:hypothetical protein
MTKQKTEKGAPSPWKVPIAAADIAETGQHFDLVADAGVRTTLARLTGLRELPRLVANFDVKRHDAGGLHVIGLVSATVGQNCVVTLEPLANEIEESVDLRFLPQSVAVRQEGDADTTGKPRDVKWDDPEPLIGDVVDLGALATEFLLLGIDPYPRKPGAVFEPPQDSKPDAGPFAALAKLTKDRDGP